MPILDPASQLTKLGAASAKLRSASSTAEVLDTFAQEAREILGVEEISATPAEQVPRNVLEHVSLDRPVATHEGTLIAALVDATARVIAVLRAPLPWPEGSDDARTAEAALTQLAIVASLALGTSRRSEDLGKAWRERDALLAGVSHDLRNPLNTFAMSCGLIRDDLERQDLDPARDLGLVLRMERAIERMRRVIDDLVEANRIQGMTVNARPENAASLVHDGAAAAEPLAAERRATIDTSDLGDTSARVLVERARGVQAVSKVISYALRVTGEGGTVRFGISRDSGAVQFTARALGRTGAASTSTQDEGRGGLALLITRTVVEAHGGKLLFDSREPSRLAFTLPAAD